MKVMYWLAAPSFGTNQYYIRAASLVSASLLSDHVEHKIISCQVKIKNSLKPSKHKNLKQVALKCCLASSVYTSMGLDGSHH